MRHRRRVHRGREHLAQRLDQDLQHPDRRKGRAGRARSSWTWIGSTTRPRAGITASARATSGSTGSGGPRPSDAPRTRASIPNKLGQEAFFNAFRRVVINGEPNEALSGGPGAISFARQNEISTSGALDPTTVVIRKGTKAAVRIDVAPGQTTTASLRYNGAVPSIDLTDATGTPIPIAAMDPAKPLNRIAGASTAVLGNTTAVELRGMAPGSYVPQRPAAGRRPDRRRGPERALHQADGGQPGPDRVGERDPLGAPCPASLGRQEHRPRG